MDLINSLADLLRQAQQIFSWQLLYVIVAAWLFVRLVEWGLPKIAEILPGRWRYRVLPWGPVLRLIVLVVVVAVAFTMITDNAVVIMAAILVGAGFAFKDYVSSLVAGMVAIYERTYRVNDWIEVGGDYGVVRAVNIRTVQIVTPDDTVVNIPHNKLWSHNVANANDGAREHMCVAEFHVDPDHDAELIRWRLYDVAMTSPYTNFTRPVKVIVQEKPWGTLYRLKAYPMDGRDEFEYISDLTVRGKQVLAALSVPPANAAAAVATEAAQQVG